MGGDHRLGQQRKQLDALLDLASVLDEWLKRRAAKNLPRLESFQFFNSIRFWPVAAAIGRAACRLSEDGIVPGDCFKRSHRSISSFL